MPHLAFYFDCLLNPLFFVAKEDFANLGAVKKLGDTITGAVNQLLSQDIPEEAKARLLDIKGLFQDYEGKSLPERREMVAKALRELSGLATEVLLRRYRQDRRILAQDVQFLKGVGKSRSGRLARKGIKTLEDILLFIPRAYDDRRTVTRIADLKVGQKAVVVGEIVLSGTVRYRVSRRAVFEMIVRDRTGQISAKWFNFSRVYMERAYKRGLKVILSGEVHSFRQQREFIHPDIEILDSEEGKDTSFGRIVPVYSETEGISQRQMRRILDGAVTAYAYATESFIPADILRRRKLVSLPRALSTLHFPGDDTGLKALIEGKNTYHHSLIFDEFFFLELGLALRRRRTARQKGIAFKGQPRLFQDFMSRLPFPLTRAQKRVLAGIEKDMGRPYPMHRLVQGDVGSGKTVVAFAAAMTAIGNGFQAAIMAPTEILAGQHYDNFRKMAAGLSVPAYLLTGSMPGPARKEIYHEVARGNPGLVIGTHALIQEGFGFGRLGLVIVDEQHRFGVLQRAALKEKGPSPDVLVMTATPIPRTLSMTLYGDLDVSIIDELPRGRKPVQTKVYAEGARPRVYEMLRRELARGGQAYIIYPLVEESETLDLLNAKEMAEQLQKEVFPDYAVGLLHGRLKGADKEAVMSRFKRGEVQVLVSTTVVEVGVDVPNATVMVIEHAERFGLSQLHQLRGRVGRGERESMCFLIARLARDSDAGQRLRVMEETTDGFRIAEEDLKIRGPGEFLGTRQSGLPELRTANIVRDIAILTAAREEAFRLIEEDPDLSLPTHRALREIVEDRWATGLALAEVG
ncbi:MAG: ATP-dependent DNA helicase RecG [Thermodesulfobacteriota bacterium]|nr:ATP-dependent DNA helicase RecG [Thermodesulfobacteriota bacterium]